MSMWTVLVRYATKIEPGVIEVEYDVDDLSDVTTIVNQGPGGFQSVAYIHVRRGDVERWPILAIDDLEPMALQLVPDRDPEPEPEF